jgi:hypothetical protein
MDSPVATELGLATSDVGYASLRFNWRGVGGSAGEPSGEISDADTDYVAALAFMKDSVEGPILACGYSWGALAALRAGGIDPRVRKLVLVAPPPTGLDAALLAACGKPMIVIAGDRDSYVPEVALREQLDAAADVEIVILEGVDHFFMTGLDEVGHAVRNWLER